MLTGRETVLRGAVDFPGALDLPGAVDFPGSLDFPGAVDFPGSVDLPGSLDFPGSVDLPGVVAVPCVAVDSVNGSWPVLLAASRKTSPRWAEVPPPPGRVKTTARAAAAIRAAVSAATRGTDFHQ